ncbi:MAG: DUF2846 domain-containing protein [Succinivibrio sp.]|nr:DUF2846 domain-containing protein [Succinivibrio sp.]
MDVESYARSFPTPPEGYSGLYIIRRNSIVGSALKKSLYVDGHYIGETATGTYFYRLVKPGVHKLQTESEFSENDVAHDFKEGENSFYQQYLKMGLFVGGAALEKITQAETRSLMDDCTRAKDQDDKKKDLKNADYSEGMGSIPAPITKKDAEKIYGQTSSSSKP